MIRAAEAACEATSWQDVAMGVIVLAMALAPWAVLLIMDRMDRKADS